MKKCLRCKKEFKENRIGTSTERKFCSTVCRNRYNAKKRYDRLKDDPEYKRKKYKYWKDVWYKKNREHFNDLMREPVRLRSLRIHKERKEKGLCTECGGERDSKFINCNKCREKIRLYYKNNEGKRRLRIEATKKWRNSSEGKRWIKEYKNNPKVKKRIKEYNKKYQEEHKK